MPCGSACDDGVRSSRLKVIRCRSRAENRPLHVKAESSLPTSSRWKGDLVAIRPGLKAHDFKLKRITGSVSVGASAGAALTVKNPVGEVVYDAMPAKSSGHRIRHHGILEMTPVTMRETIPANGVLLPGFISWGEVEVVTIPEVPSRPLVAGIHNRQAGSGAFCQWGGR